MGHGYPSLNLSPEMLHISYPLFCGYTGKSQIHILYIALFQLQLLYKFSPKVSGFFEPSMLLTTHAKKWSLFLPCKALYLKHQTYLNFVWYHMIPSHVRGVCISDMVPFYLGKLFRNSGASDDVCSKVCSWLHAFRICTLELTYLSRLIPLYVMCYPGYDCSWGLEKIKQWALRVLCEDMEIS